MDSEESQLILLLGSKQHPNVGLSDLGPSFLCGICVQLEIKLFTIRLCMYVDISIVSDRAMLII